MVIIILAWSISHLNRLFDWRLWVDCCSLNLCFSVLVISIVMAWAWVLIVLGHVLSSYSHVLHVMAEGAMLIVVLARSICDLYLFRWRLRMDGS
jgi:hypothetical protein